jgi:hypothetical protein
LSKSLQSQRTERNCFKKIADTKKIKNANTRADRKDRNKMTMTEKLNIANGLQDWKTEHQAVIIRLHSGTQCPAGSLS